MTLRRERSTMLMSRPLGPIRRWCSAAAVRRSAVVALLAAVLLSTGAALAKDPRDPGAILAAVDAIVKPEVEAWCRDKGIVYPPEAVLLRVFKRERELEIWAKNRDHKAMQLLHRSPLCAMDFSPGPKLVQGDSKTPEGFYSPSFMYESANWWMWIDLAQVSAPGVVGKGSAFRMCIDYPNALDRERSRAAHHKDPGGAICVHGNCVSIGCASLENRDFLPVYALARHHDARTFGRLQLHLFPFRFGEVAAAERAALAVQYVHHAAFASTALLRFWANLEQGYDVFNTSANPLVVRMEAGGYVFSAPAAAKGP